MRTRFDPWQITADGVVTPSEYADFHNIVDDGLTGDGTHGLIIDSGIDAGHPFFDDADVNYRDFTDSSTSPDDAIGHGTWVAGASHDVAPDATLTVYRVFGKKGKGTSIALLRAMRAAIKNADKFDAANLSLGFPSRVGEVDALLNRMAGAGITCVVAAGNSGGRGGSPATAKRAFGVGAVTIDGEVTNFSDHNPNRDNPDVSGVGRDVVGPKASGTDMLRSVPADALPDSLPGNADQYGKGAGTSIAAPILFGMILLYHKSMTSAPVEKAFEAGSRPIESTPREGAGVADYRATLWGEDGGDARRVSGEDYGIIPGADTVYLSRDVIPDGPLNPTVEEDADSVTLTFDKD